MSLVPKIRDLALPPGLERVAALGVGRSVTAVLTALAEAGGECTTATLVEQTGIITPTVLTSLKVLEAAGYVSGDVPRDARRQGVRLTWTLEAALLRRDLHALAQVWTPATT